MRITTKFIGSSALLIALTALLSGGSYVLNRQSLKALDARYVQAQETVETVMALELALQDQITALSRLAVLTHQPSEIQLYQRSRQKFFQALNALKVTLPLDDHPSHLRLQGIEQQHRYLEALAGRVLGGAETHSPSTAEATLRSLRLFENNTDIYMQALLRSAHQQTQDYREAQQALHERFALLELSGFSAVMLLLAAQFYYLLRPVLGSLKHLQMGAEKIGQAALAIGAQVEPTESPKPPPSNQEIGSLLAPEPAEEEGPLRLPKVHLETRDELQALAEAFNQMGDRLAESYRELDQRVAQRTASLRWANQSLLKEVEDRMAAESSLTQALAQLRQTQLQLLQTEKMSSLGQLVAGVAHEINNPVSFIQGNLEPAQDYVDSLLAIIALYQTEYPEVSADLQKAIARADLEFIQADFPELLGSMATGAERIATIVRSLRTFSHLDESTTKAVDLEEGLESTLLLLSSQLAATPSRPAIEVVRRYQPLPQVYCYPSQLNQVFMGLMTNAVEAMTPNLSEHLSERSALCSQGKLPTLTIATQAQAEAVRIQISDNGIGMGESIRRQIFDPFFTTKPVGSGLGLGLSMSYQIVVVNHRGHLTCESQPGVGTTFTLEIPLNLQLEQEIQETKVALPDWSREGIPDFIETVL